MQISASWRGESTGPHDGPIPPRSATASQFRAAVSKTSRMLSRQDALRRLEEVRVHAERLFVPDDIRPVMHRFVLPIIHHALLLLAFRYSLKPNFAQRFLRILLDRAFLLEFRETLGIRRLAPEVVHRLTDGAEIAGREIADRVEPVKFAVKNSTASSESELFELEKISKKSLSSTSRFQLDAKFLKSRSSCLKSQPSLTLFLNLCIVYFPFFEITP